ncbi:MAG: hypothetical protein KIH80_007495 [Flavobacteriia bacterium]|nr:hypothetical protein [Flavobacteriia bacterium]
MVAAFSAFGAAGLAAAFLAAGLAAAFLAAGFEPEATMLSITISERYCL